MRQVYLDYAATTPVKEEVLEIMLPYFTNKFGNPSTLYNSGVDVKTALDKARSRVSELIGARKEEIYFTSGGTEADNWAVIGVAKSNRTTRNHMITTKIEHHALLHSCKSLEEEGIEVTYLDVDSKGRVSLRDLERAITNKTFLISIMFANNEIGTIQPIKEIGEIAKKRGVLFHTDAVQAVGNVPINVQELNVDLLSMSAHKIYGPKGVGALYIRKGVEISNLINGGGQENNKRAGTENVPGIVGFGKAAELAKENLEEHIAKITELRDYFLEGIMANIPDVDINGDIENRLPGTINLVFNEANGSSLRLYMYRRGIEVSAGAACSANSIEPSHVLQALGLPPEKVSSSFRFSIGDFTTEEDLDYTVKEIAYMVNIIRQTKPVDAC